MCYSAWANSRLFNALAALSDGSDCEIGADKLGDMVRILNHSYVVDLIWRAHLLSEPHGFTSRNTEVQPNLAELRNEQRQVDEWFISYAEDSSAELLSDVVRFTFVDGGAGEMSRGDILLHVANHKTYHRGYVADMLYKASSRPPTMDLPVFLRDAWSAR